MRFRQDYPPPPRLRGLFSALLAGLLVLSWTGNSPAQKPANPAPVFNDTTAQGCCDTLFPAPGQKTVSLGSRFVIPESFTLTEDGAQVPDSSYRLEPVPGLLHILDTTLTLRVLVACYKSWPFTFTDSFRLRTAFPDTSAEAAGDSSRQAAAGEAAAWRAPLGGSSVSEGFRLAGFEVSGSKSVSVSGGSGAPGGGTVLDQNLMIEVAGKLSPKTSLSFRLNDQDLPLAPEGRSAELRQLDELSVVLNSPRGKVSLGDYDFSLRGFQFAQVERKLDGVSAALNGGGYELQGSAALSGGTFNSLRFYGQEGRQGPYLLTGKSGEPVHVLAGTERVYLDGKLLQRGVRADYVIDYIQGTITFTERYLIAEESRIEVDYEYGSLSFKKSFYSTTGQASGKPGRIRGYFIRESDLENSPLGEDFTPEEIDYLSRLGISGDSIRFSGVRYLGPGKGLYTMRGLGSKETYFEYLGPGRGDYMVTFREVGDYRGSYVFDQSVGGYRYLGGGLGDFEPIGEFSPPRGENRAGASFELSPSPFFRVQGEGALLKESLNLFSNRSEPLRTAHSLFAGLDTLGLGGIPARVSLWGSESTVEQGFRFQGRRYAADFERRWHLLPSTPGQDISSYGERVRESGGRLSFPGGILLSGAYGKLGRSTGERANRRTFDLAIEPSAGFNALWRHLNIHSQGVWADSSGVSPSPGSRHRDEAELSGRWKIFTPRLTLEQEKITEPGRFSDHPGSRYLELGQQLTALFSPRLEAGIVLTQRTTDYLENPVAGSPSSDWYRWSRADAQQAHFRYQGKGAFRLSGLIGRRQRSYSSLQPGKTSSTAGRLELFSGNFAGALQSHLLYELSQGSTLRNRVLYLPERYPDEGEYLEDGTYVGKAQGTHRRELVLGEIDPRQAANVKLTSREMLDLTGWIDSTGRIVRSVTVGSTVYLERASTLAEKWKLYLLFPSALGDKQQALVRDTRINTDLTVQWTDPAVYSRLEVIWDGRFDRRFESGYEESGERTLRMQLRIPLADRLQLDPTGSFGKRLRRDLAGRQRVVDNLTLNSRLVFNLNSSWRLSCDLDADRFRVHEPGAQYRRLGVGLGLVRFLPGSGRLEAAGRASHISGPPEEDLLLVDVLGLARPGTAYEATAAVSFEPAENMLLHVRYTGRTDYFLSRFTHYGRAEMKYFF